MYPSEIVKLQKRLNKPLPGKIAQFKMAPSFRPNVEGNTLKNYAGVLILLYPVNKEIYTVFMKRTEYPGAHSGQISFPGGKFDNEDGDMVNTALRETHEEIGIPENNIKIMGALTPVYIPVSNFEVFPYIGYLDHTPTFKPDTSEVSYLIEIGINTLLLPEIKKEEYQVHGTYKGQVPYFDVNNHKIWGATAMILNEFLEVWNS